MKATELMIGDWVMYNPNVFIEDEYEPSKEWEKTRILSGEDINLAVEDCYEPIPLTPEILEKNGWEKKGSPYEWKDNIWVQKWNLPIGTGNFQILDCPNYDGFTWNNVELKSVHTLQHALRLCGLNDLADNIQI